MKKISFLMAALLVAMVGCQKEPAVNDAATANGDAYMSFTIQTMTTRSQTDSEANQGDTPSDATPDFEVGKLAENQIKSVNIQSSLPYNKYFHLLSEQELHFWKEHNF